MRFLTLLVAAIAVVVVGCSGGGSAVSPIPKPTPKHTSAPNVHFKSKTLPTSSVHRGLSIQPQDSCSGTLPPLVLQATATFNPPPGTEAQIVSAGFGITAVEYQPGTCNPLNVQATYQITDLNVATTTVPPFYGNNPPPSPAPGSVNIYGNTQGTTTVTATFPDQTTAQQTVSTYPYISIGCDGSQAYLGATGWSDNGGSTNSGGDIQSSCAGTNVDSYTIPAGFQLLAAPQGPQSLAGITSGAGFQSAGTTLHQSDITFNTIVLFKTADNRFAKMYVVPACNACNEMGIIIASDASGNFPF
jgi:hypothetical protein